MTNEIKEYLLQIEKEKKDIYFYLCRLYYKPSLTLNQTNNIKKNLKNFLIFLNLCTKDNEFTKKLTKEDLKKIELILFDIKEIWKETNPYNKLENKCLTKKDLKIITNELNKEENYIFSLNELIKEITELNKEYYIKNILPQLEKKDIFQTILQDNYKKPTECFLYERHGKDVKSMKYLICDNEFIDLINNHLLSYNLPKNIIENIIEIIETSIEIKTYKSNYRYINSVDANKIKEFSYKKAIQLEKKLQEKKPIKEKIIPFKKRIKTY